MAPRIFNPDIRAAILGLEGVPWSFMPRAADADHFKVSTVPPTLGADKANSVTSFTVANCPGAPVVPVLVFVDNAADDLSSIVATITGTDQFGEIVQDTAGGLKATYDSGGAWTIPFHVAFRKITSLVFTVLGTTLSGDRYTLGFAKTYGLLRRIDAATDVIADFNGAVDAGTAETVYNTYAIAGTPDALKVLTLLVSPSGN